MTAPTAPSPYVLERGRRIRLLLTDCDGVLTDGGVYYSPGGEEWKRFSMRDGMGVERLREIAGVETGIVTREENTLLGHRAAKLGIGELHMGARYKLAVIQNIAERRRISPVEIAFVGDDVNDVPAMQAVGLSACPADAFDEVRAVAHYVCSKGGGHGAFREFAELLISASHLSR